MLFISFETFERCVSLIVENVDWQFWILNDDNVHSLLFFILIFILNGPTGKIDLLLM